LPVANWAIKTNFKALNQEEAWFKALSYNKNELNNNLGKRHGWFIT
jgi:hypothetical protein